MVAVEGLVGGVPEGGDWEGLQVQQLRGRGELLREDEVTERDGKLCLRGNPTIRHHLRTEGGGRRWDPERGGGRGEEVGSREERGEGIAGVIQRGGDNRWDPEGGGRVKDEEEKDGNKAPSPPLVTSQLPTLMKYCGGSGSNTGTKKLTTCSSAEYLLLSRKYSLCRIISLSTSSTRIQKAWEWERKG